MESLLSEYIKILKRAALEAERQRDASYQLGKIEEAEGAEKVRVRIEVLIETLRII